VKTTDQTTTRRALGTAAPGLLANRSANHWRKISRLNNAFFGQTFQRCIAHLYKAALAQPARKIWLAYINPWLGDSTLVHSGYFQRVQQHRPIPRNWTWSLWQRV